MELRPYRRVIYVGTAQSLNCLARDLLARITLYQSCHLRCSCLVSSLRLVAGLQRLLYFPENSKLVNHLHLHKILLAQPLMKIINNMKMRVWTVLWIIIRKARNHCQDVDNCGDEDHCQYHLGIYHC